ncbi:MAG: GTP cyclohydrolase I FolE [Micromonosporaceae bacterium]|nr:GTP cyclohydrolase I FolE [Micromonosporaceae bacterium]
MAGLSGNGRSTARTIIAPAIRDASAAAAARDVTAAPAARDVTAAPAARDVTAAEAAARDFLRALGVPLDRDGLADTPRRMAQAYAELLTPRPFTFTTFPNDAGYEELVLVRDIPIASVCEHHMLPFIGRAHVGYLPSDRLVGLSKLARLVERYARGVQVQERLTKEIAQWLDARLNPRGVGVVVEAEHLCMTLRGARAIDARTITSTLLGDLQTDPRSRAEFLSLVNPHRSSL